MSRDKELKTRRFFEFESFRLDAQKRVLLRSTGELVPLPPKAFQTLLTLLEEAGEVVTKAQLIAAVWPDTYVEENNLNQTVLALRRALGERPAGRPYIETIPRQGYRFVAPVNVTAGSADDPQARPQAALPERPKRTLGVAASVVILGLLALIGVASVPSWRRSVQRAFAGGEGQIRSIAVLPLENMSGDPKQDYFADGMTDELTTDLAKIGALKVISRTSAMHYRRTQEPLAQVAQELGVDAVVEGSVVRSGNRVRITAQLIDAAHDRHLWAESYERDLDDTLSLQSSVALEIARQVRVRLTSIEQERLKERRSMVAPAYDAYLKGRWEQSQQSPDALKEGQAAFQQAIALDPTYAPAYAGLADDYSLLANYGVLSPREAFPLAEAAAKKALELDPTSPEAHTALAYPASHYFWDWSLAEEEYKKAIALSPSYSTAHLRYAECLSSLGRHDEAIAEIRRAQELDPLSPLVMSNVGRFLYFARRYDEAITELRRTLQLDPSRVYARMQLAMCYEGKGMPEAREEWDKVQAAFGGAPGPGIAHFYARTGQTVRAREIARRLSQNAGDSEWFFIGGVYAALDDKDQAFASLEKAYETHDFFLAFLKVDPYMDPLRADPRLAALLRRINLSP